ncbi:MAG: chromosomal replication initiator protein DnaA [Bryobacterales bacterium]
MDVWQEICRQIEGAISRENFENWIEPLRYGDFDSSRTLHLIAPNASAKQWLEAEYQDRIVKTAHSLALDVRKVVFETDLSEDKPPEQERGAWSPVVAPVQTSLNFRQRSEPFNDKLSFGNFVVGSCNEFAHAAARAVATNPARAYNPLYVYGGVGMGKTHLMHAIGQQLEKNFPGLRVVYVTSEDFMNEMINSLRYDRMSSFRERFRSADALLVDDIQTLGSRERTQEEFFHTFNTLHSMQKQIVISSDRLPKEVPGLVDRLRSRFEWGLMADIQPPDLETKMVILDRKAEEAGVQLPDNVRIYMATQMKSNIRELEGALIRVIAIASVTGTDINLSMAKQALRSIVASSQRKVTIEAIQRVVGEEFQLKVSQLREKNNSRAVAFPRQIAMYLCKDLTGSSLPEIGRAFNGKHHTTVLHAVNKIERLRKEDLELNNLIHKLTDTFS